MEITIKNVKNGYIISYGMVESNSIGITSYNHYEEIFTSKKDAINRVEEIVDRQLETNKEYPKQPSEGNVSSTSTPK